MLPITEHSTSRASACASMITRGSCPRASSIASSSSRSADETLVIPTLDPSRDGFTQSGMPIAAACSRQPGSPACANATCGNPWNSRRRLQISLSIATAAERTLGPAYGTSRTSSNPCTVPSSPNGPWRTGKATSTPSRPPAGRRESSVPSRSQRPSRSIRIRSTSWPAASRPSATEAPEFSETSCSEERPPEITATFTGVLPLGRRRRAVDRRLLRRLLLLLEHGDEDGDAVAGPDPGPGRGGLVGDSSVLSGVVRGLLDDPDVRHVTSLEGRDRGVLRLADHVRDHHRARTVRDASSTTSVPFSSRLPGTGIRADDGALRLVRVLGLDVRHEAHVAERRLGRRPCWPEHVRHGHELRALRREDVTTDWHSTRAPGRGLGAGNRARRRRCPRTSAAPRV